MPGAVLVIDDDREALAIFARMLRAHGLAVRLAETAEAGLEQIAADPPAVIVLDLRMAAVDGVECLRRIRAIPQAAGTPVTIITSDYMIDDEVMVQIESLGARLCLKPIWEEDLLRIVGLDPPAQ